MCITWRATMCQQCERQPQSVVYSSFPPTPQIKAVFETVLLRNWSNSDMWVDWRETQVTAICVCTSALDQISGERLAARSFATQLCGYSIKHQLEDGIPASCSAAR